MTPSQALGSRPRLRVKESTAPTCEVPWRKPNERVSSRTQFPVSLPGPLTRSLSGLLSDAIRQMRDQHSHVLVATDLVARGVDLTGCDLVIHMDLPLESSTYLHRVGRAGRFGRHGQSIAIYHRSRDQVAVQSLERQLGFSLEERPDLCDIPDMVHSSSCLSSTPLYRAEPQSTVIQHQDVALDPQDSSEPWSELESNAYDAGYLQGQWAGYSAAWQILDQLFGLDSSTRPGG